MSDQPQSETEAARHQYAPRASRAACSVWPRGRRMPNKPTMPRAVLVQHHTLAGFPRPLASLRSTPFRPLHLPRRMQLRFGPRVAPAKLVIAHPVLVEVLHVPAAIHPAVKLQHPFDLGRSDPLLRRPPQSPINQTRFSVLRRNWRSDIPSSSPASIIDSSRRSQRLKTSRNFSIRRSCSHVARFIDSPPTGGRKPDKSCAT